jgi:hypothetical protein
MVIYVTADGSCKVGHVTMITISDAHVKLLYGSDSQRYGSVTGSGTGSGPFYHQAKTVRKTLIIKA